MDLKNKNMNHCICKCVYLYEDNFKKCVAVPGFVLPFEVLYTMKIEDIVDNDIELTRFGISTIHE